jgi:hypothetical protein
VTFLEHGRSRKVGIAALFLLVAVCLLVVHLARSAAARDAEEASDPGRGTNYPGNSSRAQATILIHETADPISVPGFQPDFSAPKTEKNNNKAFDKNGRQLIEGLQ